MTADVRMLQVVTPQSLNRLVAASMNDSNIIGICGETKLQNEEGSWWTMIQVKAFLSISSFHLTRLGLRVLHFPPSRQGFRESVRFRDLSPRMLHPLPYSYR